MGSGGYKLYQVFEKSCIPMLVMSALYIKILITNIAIIESDIVRYWMEYFQHWVIGRFLHKVNLAG